jgi:single-strand DNA-binding protein
MNKVILLGRLTRDPDVRYSSRSDGSKMAVARFTLAVNRRGRVQEGQQSADFISCVAFGKQGEFVEKYLKQGTKIALVGRIQTGSYKNDAGQTIYTTDIVTEEIEFAESKKDAESKPKASPEGFMEVNEDLENNLPFGRK